MSIYIYTNNGLKNVKVRIEAMTMMEAYEILESLVNDINEWVLDVDRTRKAQYGESKGDASKSSR